MVLTISAIALITVYGNSSLDVSGVKVENIDILEVFSHNFSTMILSILIGPITAGIYSLCELVINIISLGMLSNSLFLNNMSYLIPKLIPHGIIELFSLSICVVYSFCTFIYLMKNIKKIFLRKFNSKVFLSKVVTSFIITVTINTILLIAAAIVEYIV